MSAIGGVWVGEVKAGERCELEAMTIALICITSPGRKEGGSLVHWLVSYKTVLRVLCSGVFHCLALWD